jgi:vitamin B12 transporter
LFFIFTYFLAINIAAAEGISHKTITITAKKPTISPLLSPGFEVITAEKIAALQLQRLNDVLQQQPGINVVQSGPPGQISSVFIRGTNSNHVLVRIDGMRANSPDSATGNFDFSDLTTDGINTIDVIRGAASSLYGADAVGGVINIQSQKGTRDVQKIGVAEIGSTLSETLKGGIVGEYNKINFALTASVFHTSGLKTQSDYMQLPNGQYPKLPYTLRNFIFRGGGKVNDKTEVSLFSRMNDASLSYQGLLAPVPQHRRQFLNRLQVDHIISTTWMHEVGLGILSTSSAYDGGVANFSTSRGQRVVVDWQQKIRLHPTYHLQTTVEFEHEKFQANFANALSDAQEKQIGLALLQRWTPWTPLVLELALRQDWSDRFQTPACYRMGARWTVPKMKTELFVNYGTAFKAPPLFQLYGKTPGYNGNKDLQAERAESYEIGVKQPITDQIKATMIYFQNDLRQLIEYDFPSKQNVNIAKAKTKGVESMISILPTTNTKLELNHTLTLTRNEITGQALSRRPQHKVFVLGSYYYESFQFFVEWLFVGKRLDVQAQTPFREVKNQPYNIVTLKVNYDFRPGWVLFGRIENALDRKIEEPLGYRQERITGYVGIRTTI